MKSRLLHIVDMQNDFVLPDGKLYVPGAESLIEPANEFLRNVKFDKTIATFDTHYAETYKETEESKIFPSHCLYRTHGWKLSVRPRNTWVYPCDNVLKNQFDVWAQPEKIEKSLIGFRAKYTHVYIMGVASDFCVKYAIMGYLQRGYNVTVLQDLCRGINKQIDEVVAEFNTTKLKLITSKQMKKQR